MKNKKNKNPIENYGTIKEKNRKALRQQMAICGKILQGNVGQGEERSFLISISDIPTFRQLSLVLMVTEMLDHIKVAYYIKELMRMPRYKETSIRAKQLSMSPKHINNLEIVLTFPDNSKS